MIIKSEETVAIAHLYQAVPVKGAGTEQTLSQQKIPGIKMVLVNGAALVLMVPDKRDQKKIHRSVLNAAAVKICWLDDAVEEPVSKSKIDKK